MQVIPVIDANDSLTEVELEGRTYFLRLSWNSEAELWVLGIENANNEIIIAGIALVVDTPLLSQYRHLALPPGDFVALSSDGNEVISREDLPAGDVALIYLTAEDVANAAL